MLYIYQLGVRANYSADTCLSWLAGMILNAPENWKIDHQKAFNTLDHETLFDKMKCIGFSDKTKWFHCYLTNRAFSFHWILFFQKQEP